jgi:hypothetical protein
MGASVSDEQSSRGIAASTREIAVIVLGVLIALAADSVWSNWQERARERGYLEALVADLDAVEERVEASLREDALNHERASATHQLLSGGELVLPDSTQALPGFGYSEFSPHVTTLDVLIETGDLALLRSSALRADLIDLRNQLQVTARWLDRTETQIWSAHRDRNLSLEVLGPATTHLSALRQSATLRAAYREAAIASENRLVALRTLRPSLQSTRRLLGELGF